MSRSSSSAERADVYNRITTEIIAQIPSYAIVKDRIDAPQGPAQDHLRRAIETCARAGIKAPHGAFLGSLGAVEISATLVFAVAAGIVRPYSPTWLRERSESLPVPERRSPFRGRASRISCPRSSWAGAPAGEGRSAGRSIG